MTQLRATKRFTVHEYYAMGRAGILGEDDRVELIEGEVVEMPPIGSRHAGTVKRLVDLLQSGVAGRGILSVQDPVQLDEHSEPLPDLAVLRFRADYYRTSHPGPPDVLLLIEVADTSLPFDREIKVPLYAVAGIPEVWLVDIEGGAIEVFRSPEGAAYREHEVHGRGKTVTTPALLGLEVLVDDLLG